MKTLTGLTLTAVLIAAAGCATTDEDKYLADQPPPLASRDSRPAPALRGDLGEQPLAGRDRASTTIEPVKLSTKSPLTADEINENNYADAARRLEGELRVDGPATAKRK